MHEPAVSESVGFNAIRNRDCITGLRSLPAGCAQLVFADPPFNIGYEYDVYDDNREREHYLDWSREWISAVHHVLSSTGTFWLAIGDEYAAELKVLSHDIGFHCRSWVIWYYTFGVNCTRKFSRSHAHLFHFVKDPEQFTFRADAPENRLPSARQLVYRDRRANPKGRLPDDTWILRPQDLADCFTTNEDTWYFPRVAGTFRERAGFHGCQMPEQLLGRIIRVSSHENDLVIDPFAGSATTLVVAKKLGRRFYGFDVSPEYVERGTARLATVRRGDRLEGAEEPLLSVPSTGDGKSLPGIEVRAKSTSSRRPPDKGSLPLFAAQAEEEQRAASQLTQHLEAGLVAAFHATYGGHTLERLVADPELHACFLAACRKAGLPGDPRSWCLSLLDLRRAGRLAEFPVEQRTEFTPAISDGYGDASELALGRLLAQGCPDPDELLCEPQFVGEFDRIASRLAPGFAPLQYRWAALDFARQATTSRVRSAALARPRLPAPSTFEAAMTTSAADSPGVYLVSSADGAALYAGQTLNLRQRLSARFSVPQLDPIWSAASSRDALRFQLYAIDGGPEEIAAYQQLLIAEFQPVLNAQL